MILLLLLCWPFVGYSGTSGVQVVEKWWFHQQRFVYNKSGAETDIIMIVIKERL